MKEKKVVKPVRISGLLGEIKIEASMGRKKDEWNPCKTVSIDVFMEDDPGLILSLLREEVELTLKKAIRR